MVVVQSPLDRRCRTFGCYELLAPRDDEGVLSSFGPFRLVYLIVHQHRGLVSVSQASLLIDHLLQ